MRFHFTPPRVARVRVINRDTTQRTFGAAPCANVIARPCALFRRFGGRLRILPVRVNRASLRSPPRRDATRRAGSPRDGTPGEGPQHRAIAASCSATTPRSFSEDNRRVIPPLVRRRGRPLSPRAASSLSETVATDGGSRRKGLQPRRAAAGRPPIQPYSKPPSSAGAAGRPTARRRAGKRLRNDVVADFLVVAAVRLPRRTEPPGRRGPCRPAAEKRQVATEAAPRASLRRRGIAVPRRRRRGVVSSDFYDEYAHGADEAAARRRLRDGVGGGAVARRRP